MKKITILLAAALACAAANADDYTTDGQGNAYSLEALSAISASGVTKDGSTYVMNNNVTIAAGDSFALDGGATVKMADGVELRVEGTANFAASSRTLFTRASETDAPKGITLDDESAIVQFSNIDMEYAQLRSLSSTGVSISNCTFRYANGALASTGALSIGMNGAAFTIADCVFEQNTIPAIGCAANYACGIEIDNCQFIDNTTAAVRLQPQVNLTVGGEQDIKITNSSITGAQREYVGGLAVANWMGTTVSNNVIVENCQISGNAYGLTLYGSMNASIKNSTISDNKYVSDAMNGGSGISTYYYYGTPNVLIAGNTISDNYWGICVIGTSEVNAGKTDDPEAADYNEGHNTFSNNGNGGALYDLYNNSTSTVYAQGNHWGVDEQTAEKIETVIYHKADYASLGEVIYTPAWDGEGGVAAPAAAATAAARFANGTLYTGADTATVSVYSLSGALVATLEARGGSVALTGLPAGVYVARVATPSGVSAVKIAL